MQKFKIAPSILSADFTRLGEEIRAMEAGKADLIHFDVMDGVFVPEISYGEPVLRSIVKETKIPVDVHLMITEPLKHIDSFAKAGASVITFHYEAAAEKAEEVLARIHEKGIRASLSIRPDTNVEAIFPYLPLLDMVLLMTVMPGYGGQSFMEGSLDRIHALRKEIERTGLKTDIEVDGGIDMNTVLLAKNAGANVFVSGSALFRGDLAGNIRTMRRVLKKES